MTLAQIETAVLDIFGYASSTVAPWTTQAKFYLRVNEFLQRLPMRIASMATTLRQAGKVLPYSGTPRFDMWRTVANLTATSGSQTVHFPTDYDHWVSFYDNTNKATVDVLEDPDRYHLDLRDKAPGPPEAIAIMGYVTNGSTWQRYGLMYPATAASTTPSIRCTYWRIPAAMPGSSPTAEYPDIDPKYESLAIYGTVVDLARPSSPEFDRYSALETALLTELAMTARGA